jgi:hypothetical protein
MGVLCSKATIVPVGIVADKAHRDRLLNSYPSGGVLPLERRAGTMGIDHNSQWLRAPHDILNQIDY